MSGDHLTQTVMFPSQIVVFEYFSGAWKCDIVQ